MSEKQEVVHTVADEANAIPEAVEKVVEAKLPERFVSRSECSVYCLTRYYREMTARVVLPGASDEQAEVDTDEEAAEEEKGAGDNDDDLLQHFPDKTEVRSRDFRHPPTYRFFSS